MIVLPPEPDLDAPLSEALVRILGTSYCPKYLADAARPWLQRKG